MPQRGLYALKRAARWIGGAAAALVLLFPLRRCAVQDAYHDHGGYADAQADPCVTRPDVRAGPHR